MEKMKEDLNVDEYSASQTTLEQIFNGFARDDEHIVEERVFDQNSIGDHHNFKFEKANIYETRNSSNNLYLSHFTLLL